MIISVNSLKIFLSLNSFLLFSGWLQYELLQLSNDSFITNYGLFVLRNYFLLYFIDLTTRSKRETDKNNKLLISPFLSQPEYTYNYELHWHVCQSTLVEAITHKYNQQTFFTNSIRENIDINSSYIAYFIPISLLFEIIFDFFHYSSHRLLHNGYLYKYIHKKHHKFKHPIAIATFYQEPLDIFLTNSVPTIITLCLIRSATNIPYLQYNWITIYKTFVEISGHTGKELSPSCSFSQCIWLVKGLNIELYAEDHELHHLLNNCNYGKRFSLWDKVFGTFTSSQQKKREI